MKILTSILCVLSTAFAWTIRDQHTRGDDTDKYLAVPFLPLLEPYCYTYDNIKVTSSTIRVISDTTVEAALTLSETTSDLKCQVSGIVNLHDLDLSSPKVSCSGVDHDSNRRDDSNLIIRFSTNPIDEVERRFDGAESISAMAGQGEPERLWIKWIKDRAAKMNEIPFFPKTYSEGTKRFSFFLRNLVRIAWMNAIERGTATYGQNDFAHISAEEFATFYKLPKHSISTHLTTKPRNYISPNYNMAPPDEWDWRQHNAVTPVKNQGACGSCWSFSTTGNIEGVHAVATGDLISLSEQELVDCDTQDQGCNGGLMDNAFEEIERLGGLETERDYSYKAHGEKCKFDESKIAVKISGYHDVPQGDEGAMQAQLLETGPLAVALNAMWMQFYRGGVSHPWKKLCSPSMLDHGVLIVGYGVQAANPDHLPFPKPEQPFWTIKNSWSASWGEDGYYRLFRGDGTCGIDQYVTTAEA